MSSEVPENEAFPPPAAVSERQPAEARAGTAVPPRLPEAPRVRRAGAVLSPAPLALALYLSLSLLYFGRPVLAHMASVVIARDEVDSSSYQWFLAWWPHAVLHGLNPFITHAVFVPEGYNLTWTPSLAGPALLLSPVTLLLGPTVAFNIFGLLAPTLSAWAAFLLCRHITRATWPSLAAGYVFGFSGYVLTTMQGDPWLALAAVPPAFVLLVLKRLDGSLGSRWFVALIGAGVIFEFLTATEMLATTTLFGAFALLVAYALFGERRGGLRAIAGEMAIAYVAAAVVLSPFLYFMLRPHTPPLHAALFVGPTDPISLFVPSELQARGAWQAAQWAKIGVPASQDTFPYLGLPLLVIVVVFAVRYWRERTARLLAICFAASVVAVMGTRLVIVGHHTGLTLPWELFRHLPLLKYALPFRTAVYSSLLAAVILAVWLARRPGAVRWGAALLAVAALLPSLSTSVWHSAAVDPRVFQDGRYKAYLSPRDNVLTIPLAGPNQRWQARTGFAFRYVNGYVGPFPESSTRFPAWTALRNGQASRDWPQALHAYIAAKRVTVIVLDKRYGGQWRQLFAPLGIEPVDAGGAYFYRLARPLHH